MSVEKTPRLHKVYWMPFEKTCSKYKSTWISWLEFSRVKAVWSISKASLFKHQLEVSWRKTKDFIVNPELDLWKYHRTGQHVTHSHHARMAPYLTISHAHACRLISAIMCARKVMLVTHLKVAVTAFQKKNLSRSSLTGLANMTLIIPVS